MARTTDRDRTRRDKQQLAGMSAHGMSQPLHHGKRFAETEARVRARVHPADASPASDDHLGSTDAQVSPVPAHASSGATASETGQGAGHPRLERLSTEPALPATTALLAFVADAVEAFGRLGKASRAVALLPVRAGGLLLRLGRRWMGGSPGRA